MTSECQVNAAGKLFLLEELFKVEAEDGEIREMLVEGAGPLGLCKALCGTVSGEQAAATGKKDVCWQIRLIAWNACGAPSPCQAPVARCAEMLYGHGGYGLPTCDEGSLSSSKICRLTPSEASSTSKCRCMRCTAPHACNLSSSESRCFAWQQAAEAKWPATSWVAKLTAPWLTMPP